MQSLPVVIIRCEENKIYQLDFRIETDNIRCFILLSGLRNWTQVKVPHSGRPSTHWFCRPCLRILRPSLSLILISFSLSPPLSLFLSLSLSLSFSFSLSLSLSFFDEIFFEMINLRSHNHLLKKNVKNLQNLWSEKIPKWIKSWTSFGQTYYSCHQCNYAN